MANFASFSELRAVCLDLPSGHPAASAAVAQRETTLTKPPQSLGRLEDLVAWLAHWQGHAPPRLDRVDILVFAGNHGVTRQGVSAYPAEVTAQMVANFAAGGAAINQLAQNSGANLRVIPLALDEPTADFTGGPALTETEFLAALATGYDAVSPDCDLVCLGEMGIGNTTAAAAIAAA
ncbi:MAG: nicotinate-nucleotide--dimethylbenzimidazole phosphoribosyltransferase, partial [Xanthobacteraceae bacterium]